MRPVLSHLLVIACAVTSLAHAQRPITLDDIMHLSIPDDPQCSPDGKSVVYTLSHPGGKEHVWMINYDGSDNRQLTSGDQGERRPRLSPDGKYLSYLSSSQIWLRPLYGGGKAKAIAKALSYEWSPDANALVIVASNSGPVRGTHIYLLQLTAKKLRPLTSQQATNEDQPSWSPDGKSIAFIADQRVSVVGASSGAPYKAISETNATPGAHIDWSPDGRTLAFLVGEERRLAIAPADGSAKPRILKAATDLDRGGWAPSWGDSGKAVFVTVADDMSVNGFKIPIDEAGRAGALFPRPIVLGARHHAGGCAAVISSGDTKPNEILALDNGTLRQVTHLNDHLVAEIQWPKTEEIKFASKDGTEVHGLLTYPLGYKTATRVPLLLRIHDGPKQQDDHSFNPEAQYFAANRYGVLRINYRGSDGRGSRFHSVDAAIDDLDAGIDYAIRAGIANPERLGIAGSGYGGILTESVIAASRTRFKAATIGVRKQTDKPIGPPGALHSTPSLFFVGESGTVRNRYELSLAWYDKYMKLIGPDDARATGIGRE